MDNNNNGRTLESGVLKELLRKGLIAGVFTTGGIFVLGGISGIISTAIGLILAFIERDDITTAYERISSLSSNHLVRVFLSLIPPVSQMPWMRIWQGLVNVVNMLTSLSPSGSGKMIKDHKE